MEQEKISANQNQKVNINKQTTENRKSDGEKSFSPHRILREVTDKKGKLNAKKLASFLKGADSKRKKLIFKIVSKRFGIEKAKEIFEEIEGTAKNRRKKLSKRARRKILRKYRKKYYKEAKGLVASDDFDSITEVHENAFPILGKTIFINRKTGEVVVTVAFSVKQIADFLLKETASDAVFVTSDGQKINVSQYPDEVIMPGQRFKVVVNKNKKGKEGGIKNEIKEKLDEKTDLQAQAVAENYEEIYSIIKEEQKAKELDDYIRFLEIKLDETDKKLGVSVYRIVASLPGRKTPVVFYVYEMLNTNFKKLVNESRVSRSVIMKLHRSGKIPPLEAHTRVVSDKMVDVETIKKWSKQYEKESKEAVKKSLELRIKFFNENPNLLYQLANDRLVYLIQSASTEMKIKILKTLLNTSNKYERTIRLKVFASFSPSQFEKFIGTAASEGWLDTFNGKFTGNDYFIYMKLVGDKLKGASITDGKPAIVWKGERGIGNLLYHGGQTLKTEIGGQTVSIQIGTMGVVGEFGKYVIDDLYQEFKENTKSSRKYLIGGVIGGIMDSIEKTLVEALKAVDSPAQTAKAVVHAVLHPRQMLTELKKCLGKKWDDIIEALEEAEETGDYSKYYSLVGELTNEIVTIIVSGAKVVKDVKKMMEPLKIRQKITRASLNALRKINKRILSTRIGKAIIRIVKQGGGKLKSVMAKTLKQLKKAKKGADKVREAIKEKIIKIKKLYNLKGIKAKIRKGIQIAHLKKKLKVLISKKIEKLSTKGMEAVIFLIEKFGMERVALWLKKMFNKRDAASVDIFLKSLKTIKDPSFVKLYLSMYVRNPKLGMVRAGLTIMRLEEAAGKVSEKVLKARAKFISWTFQYHLVTETEQLFRQPNFYKVVKEAKLPKVIRQVLDEERFKMVEKIRVKVVEQLYKKYHKNVIEGTINTGSAALKRPGVYDPFIKDYDFTWVGKTEKYSAEAKKLFDELFKKEYGIPPEALDINAFDLNDFIRKAKMKNFDELIQKQLHNARIQRLLKKNPEAYHQQGALDVQFHNYNYEVGTMDKFTQVPGKGWKQVPTGQKGVRKFIRNKLNIKKPGASDAFGSVVGNKEFFDHYQGKGINPKKTYEAAKYFERAHNGYMLLYKTLKKKPALPPWTREVVDVAHTIKSQSIKDVEKLKELLKTKGLTIEEFINRSKELLDIYEKETLVYKLKEMAQFEKHISKLSQKGVYPYNLRLKQALDSQSIRHFLADLDDKRYRQIMDFLEKRLSGDKEIAELLKGKSIKEFLNQQRELAFTQMAQDIREVYPVTKIFPVLMREDVWKKLKSMGVERKDIANFINKVPGSFVGRKKQYEAICKVLYEEMKR